MCTFGAVLFKQFLTSTSAKRTAELAKRKAKKKRKRKCNEVLSEEEDLPRLLSSSNRINKAQTEELISYMVKHPAFAQGKQLGYDGSRIKEEMWEELAGILNKLGSHKHVEQRAYSCASILQYRFPDSFIFEKFVDVF